jgi:hypothetical protein
MTPRHYETENVDFAFEGEILPCSFFITDERLLTATAAGQRRTVELGATPPLALTESIWTELLHAARMPKPVEHHEPEAQQDRHENRIKGMLGLVFGMHATLAPEPHQIADSRRVTAPGRCVGPNSSPRHRWRPNCPA